MVTFAVPLEEVGVQTMKFVSQVPAHIEPFVDTFRRPVLSEANEYEVRTVAPPLSVAVGESWKTSPLFREMVLSGTVIVATTLALGASPPQELRVKTQSIARPTRNDENRRMYPPRGEFQVLAVELFIRNGSV
jgi:hypothetical protein